MNDNDSDNDHRIQDDEEQEQIDAAAAAEQRLPQLISLLQKKKTFSLRTRNKMDVLVKEFLTKIKDDIQEMLCDDNDIESEAYRGLDSDRDTEMEVETAIRFFPEILSTRKHEGYWDEVGRVEEYHEEWREGFYPIQYLVCFRRENGICIRNLKAISFVPLVARLSKEFGQFPEEERVGLLVEGWNESNCIDFLMSTEHEGNDSQEYHESIDDKCLLVMKELRHMGLLKKEDIQRHYLFTCLYGQSFFAEKRFRFLVEWDPTLLLSCEPLDYAAWESSIQGFRVVFEYGILYYPTKKGISMLFKKYGGTNKTPFNVACIKHGCEEVMDVVEETLLKFQRRSDYDDNNNSNNTGPYNVVDTLMTAAINENIHLDCLYFLLRREPDILEKLLSSSSTMKGMLDSNDNNDDDISSSSSKSNTSNNNTNNKEDSKDCRKRSSSCENDNNSVNDDLLIATSLKKRKR